MTEINDIKHLVVVGAWNITIFTPDWMKKYILSDYPQFNVEVPIAINSSLRYTTDDFIFAIVNSRLEVIIKNNPDHAIACVRTVLQKLIHTPILAFGINFKFNANKTELSDELWKNFFVDSPVVQICDSYQLLESSTIATYKINEICNLRLNVTKNTDESVSFDFNYEYQVKSAQDLIEVIGTDDSLFRQLHELTYQVLDKYFNLHF